MINIFKTKKNDEPIKRIGLVGHFYPRASEESLFFNGLYDELKKLPETGFKFFPVAISPSESLLPYPGTISFQINEKQAEDYIIAAQFLNDQAVDAIVLQYEAEVFGATAGENLVALLRQVHIPVILLLHRVQENPPASVRRIIGELIKLSHHFIVMNRQEEAYLQDLYSVSANRISKIPYAAPEPIDMSTDKAKRKLKLKDKHLLVTQGIFSEDSGLDILLDALPEILKEDPLAHLLILGPQHQSAVSEEESLFDELKQRVDEKKLQDHVTFDLTFVDQNKLMEVIAAADVVITASQGKHYSSPQPVIWGMSAGKPIVTTPFGHIAELLEEGRGLQIDTHSTKSIVNAVVAILTVPAFSEKLRDRAAPYAKRFYWSKVADAYAHVIEKQLISVSSPAGLSNFTENKPKPLPKPSLKHVLNLTDDVGIVHQSNYFIPDRNSGYRTTDQALGLQTAVTYFEFFQSQTAYPFIQRYLTFLYHSFQKKEGCFNSWLKYNREWETQGSQEQTQGRVLWALGQCLSSGPQPFKKTAKDLFQKGLSLMELCEDIEGCSYAVLGLCHYLELLPHDKVAETLLNKSANYLLKRVQKAEADGWKWPEETLGTNAAVLPLALITAGDYQLSPSTVKEGITLLSWLLDHTVMEKTFFSFIGSEGGLKKGKSPSTHNQLPFDCTLMSLACLQAFKITDNSRWKYLSRLSLQWFLGLNRLQLPIYDSSSSGCFDALTSHGVNENQSAEATLAFQFGLLSYRNVIKTTKKEDVSQKIQALAENSY